VAAGAGWHAIAATDLNGDRQPDILFQSDNGLMAAWLMNRTEFITAVVLNKGVAVASGLRLVGASDFNLDGNNDLLWQKTDGTLSYWQMLGINSSSTNALFSSQPVSLNLHCVSPK
jgi:hypothetical protein